MAQAQMMYVCKAVFLGTTPMSLLAKVCHPHIAVGSYRSLTGAKVTDNRR